MSGGGIVRNYGVNILGAILPLLIGLITIPIYVHAVGDERYGVISIVWLLLGYAGFLDLGLARASENALARASLEDPSERSKVIVTSFSLNLILGFLGAGIMYASAAIVLERVLNITPSIHAEVWSAVPWIAVLLPAALVSGLISGSLESRERFASANLISVLSTSIGQVTPVICATVVSNKLDYVIPTAVLTRLFCIVAALIYVYRCERPLAARHFDRHTARELLRYGGWVTVSSIISPMLVSLDQFVVGWRTGVANVTFYAVPMTLISRSQVFAAAMAKTIFPRLSRYDLDQASLLAEQSTNFLALAFAIVCGPAIFLVTPAISLWIGADFAAKAAPVAQILLLGAWINGVAFIPFGFLQARGMPDVTAKFHLLESVPYVLVLVLLCTHFGLLGAAIAWTLRVAVDAVLMFWAAKFKHYTSIFILIIGFLLATLYTVAQFTSHETTASLVFALMAGIFIFFTGVTINSSARAKVKQVYKQIFRYRLRKDL